MAMNGIERLQQQHEGLLEALDELEFTADPEERVRLLAHIGQRLKAHAAVEDEVFYPAVRDCAAQAPAAVAEAIESHLAVDVLLDEMIGAEIGAAKVKVLRDLVRRHFEHEERTLLPLARDLDEESRTQLAHAIDAYLDEFGDGLDDTLPAP
jgi:hemerythrin-like domain-containing protein